MATVPGLCSSCPRASLTHLGSTYSCFLYCSISSFISCLYFRSSSSKSTCALDPICSGRVFCLSLGFAVDPVRFFLNLRSLIFEAIFSPVCVLLVLYVLGGGSFSQSGSGIAHLAISGSSFPGLLSYVGYSLNPALGVPCLIRLTVI